MILQADERVLEALGVVLGTSPGLRIPYPSRIDRRLLKTAFRKRAHLLHPDKARALGIHVSLLAHRFRELKSAYDFLAGLLDVHATIAVNARGAAAPPRPAPPPAATRSSNAAPRTETTASPGNGNGNGKTSAPTGSTQAGKTHGFRHSGAVPRRRLRFAQYLYYSRVIDWQTLVSAMRWQYRMRPRLGDIARQMSYLSSDDVCDILRHKGLDERFGEAALRLRRLDLPRLLTLLGRQRHFDRPIGRFFVEHAIVTPEELSHLLERHMQHNLTCAAAEFAGRGRRGGTGHSLRGGSFAGRRRPA
jgi:hypothetical protein